MNFNDIIKPGTEVKLKSRFSSLHGIIRGVWVGKDGFQYEVTIIHNGAVTHQYIPEEMFDVVSAEPMPVGFQLSPHSKPPK